MTWVATYFLPGWRAKIKTRGDWHKTRWQPVSVPVTVPDGPPIKRHGLPYQPKTLAIICVTIPTSIDGVPICDVQREIDDSTAHWYKHNPPSAQPFEKGLTRL